MYLEFVILWYYNPNPPVPINQKLECVTVAAVLSRIMTVLHYSLRAVERSS